MPASPLMQVALLSKPDEMFSSAPDRLDRHGKAPTK